MKPFLTILCLMLCVLVCEAQVIMPPAVTVLTNWPDTNTINLTAICNPASNSIAYRFGEWIAYSPLTNLLTVIKPSCTFSNLPETNDDYGFCVAVEGTNGAWSSNSAAVYWGTPNHFLAAYITQTNSNLTGKFADYFTNLTQTNFDATSLLYVLRVASSNWFAPTNPP